uniref:Uncharacterized protein n=1 Tax=Xenopus tropicalis TaxID=8364 RepID=A0A1B8Y1V1_XENTR
MVQMILNQEDLPPSYQALNALKETWSLWLTLHEKDIRAHRDIVPLREELLSVLERKSQSLQNGESENFYDFIKVAMGRTYLCMKHKDKEFGALSYWEKAESTDPVYQSISLYNRAFITINGRKHGYIEEAIKLLSKAKETMNIYISEILNVISCGSIITKMSSYEPHCESSSFSLQMMTRMDLLKSWVNGIEESINKLKERKENNKDAVTKERMVYSLCENYGTVVTEEMSLLHDYGLTFVFNVEQKPEMGHLKSNEISSFLVSGGIGKVTQGAANAVGVAKISTKVAKITTAGKEVLKQGVKQDTMGLECVFDMGAQAALKGILERTLKHKIQRHVENNQELLKALLNFIVGEAVPEAAKHTNDPKSFQIAPCIRENVKKIVQERSILAFEETMRNSTIIRTVKSALQPVSNCIIRELKKQKNAQKYVKIAAIVIDIAVQLTDIFMTLPTESMFNEHLLPKISAKMAPTHDCTHDPRATFPDVLALEKELRNVVLEALFDQFSNLISSQTKGVVGIAWGNHFVEEFKEKWQKNSQ